MGETPTGHIVFLCKCNQEKFDQSVTTAAISRIPGVGEVKAGDFYCGEGGQHILREVISKAGGGGASIVLSCRKNAEWFEEKLEDLAGDPLVALPGGHHNESTGETRLDGSLKVVNIQKHVLESSNAPEATDRIIGQIEETLRKRE